MFLTEQQSDKANSNLSRIDIAAAHAKIELNKGNVSACLDAIGAIEKYVEILSKIKKVVQRRKPKG